MLLLAGVPLSFEWLPLQGGLQPPQQVDADPQVGLPGHHVDQKCHAIRIPPWIRAQYDLLITLSVVCAIACSQAEFTLPPYENNLKLQGSGAADLCLGRTVRRLGGLELPNVIMRKFSVKNLTC